MFVALSRDLEIFCKGQMASISCLGNYIVWSLLQLLDSAVALQHVIDYINSGNSYISIQLSLPKQVVG